MKRLLAFILVVLISAPVFAGELPDDAQKGPKGGKGRKANANAQNNGPAANRNRNRSGGPGAMRFGNPADLVAKMIQEFDKDGDSKLNQSELQAMFKMMQERRGQMQNRPNGNDSPRQAGQMRRRGTGGRGSDRAGGARPGGEKPERPKN